MKVPSSSLFVALLLMAAACDDKTLPDVDYSCKIQPDCAVKDVGSCCGTRLRCVSADFEPDLEGVDEFCDSNPGPVDCEDSIEITSCQCIDNRCRSMHGNEEI